jgi:hypothetical protein
MMTTTTTARFKIPIGLCSYKLEALVDPLQAINDNGPGGCITTVKLLKRVRSTNYGRHTIKCSIKEDYIKRVIEPKPPGEEKGST